MSLFLLGLKALWRQRTLLLFTSAGLAAVLGPLLLLYGFKFGVIAALLAALRDDPTNREIVLRGNYVVHPADIEKYRTWPEVAFVQPATDNAATVHPDSGMAGVGGSRSSLPSVAFSGLVQVDFTAKRPDGLVLIEQFPHQYSLTRRCSPRLIIVAAPDFYCFARL